MRLKIKTNIVVLLFCLTLGLTVSGQPSGADPLQEERFHFVNYDANLLEWQPGYGGSGQFFGKLDTLLQRGEGQVHIAHIGGSHLQTDIYSHQIRKRLQLFQPGMHGGRGMVFPVAVTGSNNPVSFRTAYTGQWNHCRNTQRNATCNYGLPGMMVVTSDSLATITISNRDPELPFGSEIIRLYYFDPTNAYRIALQASDPWLVHSVEEGTQGYIEFRLNAPTDTFTLEFHNPGATPGFVEIYGIELRSEDPGVVYHAFGVNGASIPSYLRVNLFTEHLEALRPDLVILSLGTNDGYSSRFDPSVFEKNYIDLITAIRDLLPNASIVITVPNDVYLRRRRPNPATKQQEEVIYRLAQQYHCGVWNFFQVMGGFNSSPQWLNNNMMQRDRIHFTREGYLLKGDLLFTAIVKSYGDYLENQQREINN